MSQVRRDEGRRTATSARWGLVASTGGALILLGRLGVHGLLTRDQAVYAYAGQQLFHGVPPYASVFDPKGPVGALLAAIGAAVAAATGHAELTGIRLVFGAIACLGVSAVYLLSRELWGGTVPGVVSAAAVCAMPALTADAFSGPDAKAPAFLLLTLTMWLALRERWLLASAAAALGTLTWQPLVFLPVLVLLCAAIGLRKEDRAGRRPAVRDVLAGFVGVMGAFFLFFLVTGTVGLAFDATVRFPLEGIRHGQTSAGARVGALMDGVFSDSGGRGVVWCIGVIVFVVLLVTLLLGHRSESRDRLRDPIMLLVLLPFLAIAGYSLVDFQGAPDLLPWLPFAGVGVGGLSAAVSRSMAGRTSGGQWLPATLVLALVAAAWVLPSGMKPGLACERRAAAVLEGSVPTGSTMWAFGDPAPLVLDQRRNPDRFVYLASGVAAWKVRRTAGGLAGWMAQIRGVAPAVVVFGGYDEGDIYRSLVAMFGTDGYTRTPIGRWDVYTRGEARVADVRGVGCRQ